MPIFEYQCKDCGHRFEQIVFRSEALTKCPVCHSHETERLISSFAMSGGSTKSAGSCGPGKFT